MTHYQLRPLEFNKKLYELSKFTDKPEPDNTYIINFQRETCDCPSRQQPCKHIAMVQKFLDLGDWIGVAYDPDDDTMCKFMDIDGLSSLTDGEP